MSFSLSLSLFRLAASFYKYQSQKESKTARSSFTETVEESVSRVFCGCFCSRLFAFGGEKFSGGDLLGVEKKKLARKKRASLEEEEREE